MHQRGGGGYQVSSSKNFVTQYRKISLGNTSVFQKISGSEKFYASERERGGGYQVSSSKNFVTQYRKISLGNTSVFQKISGSENFYASERGEGVSRFSVEIFCLTVPKISVGGNPLVFH